MNLTKEQALQLIDENTKRNEELKQYVEGLEKPRRRELKNGQTYFILGPNGEIFEQLSWRENTYDNWENDYLYQGNAFHTKEEAEVEKMRRESMATRFDFIPKKEESFWYWSFSRKEPTWLFFDPDFSTEWHLGSVKRTREECQAWGDKYAAYFTIPKE